MYFCLSVMLRRSILCRCNFVCLESWKFREFDGNCNDADDEYGCPPKKTPILDEHPQSCLFHCPVLFYTTAYAENIHAFLWLANSKPHSCNHISVSMRFCISKICRCASGLFKSATGHGSDQMRTGREGRKWHFFGRPLLMNYKPQKH